MEIALADGAGSVVTATDLSVVLAASTPPLPLHEVLAAIARACRGIRTEVILVSQDVAASGLGSLPVRVINSTPGTLTHVQWGQGARAATGRVVAFTTDQMRLGDGWGAAVIEAIDAGAVGVGGPIAIDANADAATKAAHLIRFSAFLPGRHRSSGVVADIAGDNGAYERAAIVQHEDLLRDGFWEVEFHRRFGRDGRQLVMVPDALATFVGPVSFRALARQRFRHALEFGRTRVLRHGASAWRIGVLSPLVPVILLARMWRRSRVNDDAVRNVRRVLPRLLILAVAWALGEACGALSTLRHGRKRT